ncbi:hypothetical protein OJAV_G00102270 [Oryzias javanicus]|uniref:Uncharacterized protein n=1 Tax=Oryzias javanicus TaxID=123683 RepID=A0A3S2PI81_ORYJA|nr:hypothetical protein OJAV_G00102270 [Oryzias javanicus]
MSHDGVKDSESLTGTLTLSETASSPQLEQAVSSEDLKRENSLLRSELHDARDELQRRLDDLETQRRAESEAKTRLKQLSRKHASQTVEREEKEKEWRTQLEKEKAETEKLRKEINALEVEISRIKKERDQMEKEEEDTTKNDRESEMIELNIQLKNQLAEVKAQLALELEERRNEENEKNQLGGDLNKDLNMQLAELKAELEALKHGGKSSPEEKKVPVVNSPLTYLTLHDDEFNLISQDEKLLSSPEQHRLFCRSANQLNMLLSTATADFLQQDQTLIDVQYPPLGEDDQSSQVDSDVEHVKVNYKKGISSSDLQESEHLSSDQATELKRLQSENAKETRRANQYQVKLEALQKQVTRQTQHLTTAFERQSQHISGLLAELQEKENAYVIQEKELQRYKEELAALRAEKKSSRDRDVASELLTVRKENQLLEPNTGASDQRERADEEPKEDATSQNLRAEQEVQDEPNVLISEQHLLQEEAGLENEEEREDCAATEGEGSLKEVSEKQMEGLQLQVEALQRKIRALSEETRQQAQELTVWRLASQPASALDPLAINTDDECGSWDEAIEVFNTFVFDNPGDEEKLDAVLSKFDAHCSPKKTETYERYVFRSRTQRTHEPFDSFLTDLRLKAQSCNFATLKDSMIRVRLSSSGGYKIRGRLLRETELTLAKP